ncbi:class I SAM-dependent methyltransferase [Patescibacteria group bacterium]|nr:class I SAM-dependent methyltransferase [Patescibacteria group bacterium]
MKKLTKNEVLKMGYVDFLALLNETNRPPGGKDSVRRMAINSFINFKSKVLHSGCNTGYCSFEISHLTKCKVNAVDVNKNMVAAGKKKLKLEPDIFKNNISFSLSDAHKLNFKSNMFDLVFSGGSTAFMKNPPQVVKEYKRVCKPYGFIGDMCMFYKKKPPLSLLNKINKLLNIKIKPWDKQYWVSLYTNEGLELFYDYTDNMPYDPTSKEVMVYCEKMIRDAFIGQDEDVIKLGIKKFFSYMSLFNENHKYIAYSVLLFRKNMVEEQISLFGK